MLLFNALPVPCKLRFIHYPFWSLFFEVVLGALFGPILGPFWSPFWSHFGVLFGGLLPVDSLLRHEAVFATFSDPSDVAKSLKNHGFFEVLAMSAEVWHDPYMAPEWSQKGSNFGPKMSPKWLRKWFQIWSYFGVAFWTENGSQKRPQNDPKRGT